MIAFKTNGRGDVKLCAAVMSRPSVSEKRKEPNNDERSNLALSPNATVKIKLQIAHEFSFRICSSKEFITEQCVVDVLLHRAGLEAASLNTYGLLLSTAN